MGHASLTLALVLALPVWVWSGEKLPPLPTPPVQIRPADGEFGPEKWRWEGVAVVADPLNKETLYLGGRVGGVEFGSIGNWALAEDGKTWRELKSPSVLLDPLREMALAARGPAKDGEAAARNVFYAAMDAAKEAEAVKDGPSKLAAMALKCVGELTAAFGMAKPVGWEKEAVERATPLVEKATKELTAAQAGFAAGRLDALLLKSCFEAQWALDEAAECLASSPGPREFPCAAYDPENKCVVLFGGSHGDYALPDTWIYDCIRKAWRQVWSATTPSPRMGASMKWLEDRKLLSLTGGQTMLNKMVYQAGEMPAPPGDWTFDAKAGTWSGQDGVTPGTRAYRTIVPGYNPCWYDAAPRGDPQVVDEWLAEVEPNVWTTVPPAPAQAPEREWGTAILDPDRDQIYRWSGGHQADPSNIVSTYHPQLNRWSIPYVAEIMLASSRKGMSFNGRPDCANHTYLHYAYDTVSRHLVCIAMGGTGLYNPDRREFACNFAHPFNRQIYETCTVSTPQGVVAWVRGWFGILDVKAREWKKLPVAGKLPAPQCDGSAICYDSKRDALWLTTFLGYQKPSGQIWRYSLKTGAVEAFTPANQDAIGKAKGFNSEIRESVYVPKADIVLYNNFVNGREVAYDPQKNRWVVLNIARKLERLGTVSDTLVYDAKRELVWNLNAYKLLYVLRLDPGKLVLSDDPQKAAE